MRQTVTLGDVCKRVMSGGTPSTRKLEFYGGDIPWLRTQEVNFGRIYSTGKTISEAGLKGSSAKLIPENSVIIAMYGATAGKVAINKVPLTTNQACCNLIIDSSKANYEYIYYHLLNNYDKLLSAATGAAQQNLGTKQIAAMKIDLPNLVTQNKIAGVLGAIDKKIEVNRRMNETLEQMGQALFQNYFIEEKSKNQAKYTIGDVANIIDCLHSKKPEQLLENTGNIYLQLNNIADSGTLNLANKFYLSDEDYKKWTSRIEASENDFVITNVGRSGAVAKIPRGVKAALGRNMTAIRLKDKFMYPGFFSFYLNSGYFKKQVIANLDHGTILSALNVKSIPKLQIPNISHVILDNSEKQLVNLRTTIEENHNQIQNLTNLRDLLLPRLISGKTQV